MTFTPSIAEARIIQQQLATRLVYTQEFQAFAHVVGVDVGYDSQQQLAHASLVQLRLPDLALMQQVRCSLRVDFPYVPGLLSFREAPVILAALAQLREPPVLLMVDGHGIAHPKRLGIAAHMGVLLDVPSIGVAKSRLVGEAAPPGERKGDTSALMHRGVQLGYVLRSKERTNPLYVSPGHRMALQQALDLTLQCLTRYRLPEPTRLADKFSKHMAAEKF